MNTTAQNNALSNMRFGIEIECKGISRERAQTLVATTIERVTETTTTLHQERSYDSYCVKMADGRVWKAMSDGSIGFSNAEVVSPILKLSDMDLLQEIVRTLRSYAYTDTDCGIHIHVDAANLDAPAIGRLAAITYANQDLLKEALNLDFGRQSGSYGARDITEKCAKAMRKARTLAASQKAWYKNSDHCDSTNPDNARHVHYHDSRYHGLNLHSTFYRGTVEFRYFDATLHAGKIRAWVCLCLSLVNTAKNCTRAPVKKARLIDGDKKWTMYCLCYYKLGMRGEYFKNVRDHLTKNLAGELRGGGRRPLARAA